MRTAHACLCSSCAPGTHHNPQLRFATSWSQSLIIISYDPDATSLPSGENATAATGLEWPSSVGRGAPVARSQSLTVLSRDPDASSPPSGENAMAQRHSEWPTSIRRGAPVASSQSLTVLSRDPDASSPPSGENATAKTQFEWPSSVLRAESWIISLGSGLLTTLSRSLYRADGNYWDTGRPVTWFATDFLHTTIGSVRLGRLIGTFFLLAQKRVFCKSDLDKSTTHMRTLMIYLFLTGVHPTSVHLIGGYLMGMYLTCVYLTDVHLTGVYLMGVYLTGLHLTGLHLMAMCLMGVRLTGVHLMA